MEIVLGLATILGGVAAVWYFVEKYRESRKPKKRPIVLPPVASNPQTRTNLEVPVFGASQSGRTPFFISEPITELESAKKESKKQNKPLFLVIYNEEHPTKSKLYYSLGCFLDYFTTKKLVEDHFVSALVPSNEPQTTDFIPEDDPLENSLWVVMRPDGKIIRQEGVYANPDEGLKRVRSVISEVGA